MPEPAVGPHMTNGEIFRSVLINPTPARLGAALARAEAGDLGRAISPHAVAMLRLLVITGARHSEILTLRWDEVNFERGCIELSDSKTGEKEIFLPPAALQILSDNPRKFGNPLSLLAESEEPIWSTSKTPGE